MLDHKKYRFFVAFLTLFTCFSLLTLSVRAQEPDEDGNPPDSTSEEVYKIQKIVDPPGLKAKQREAAEANLNSVPATSTGGPDDFGYVYKDSSEADGPTYDFVELAGTDAIELNYGDETLHGALQLGFTFEHYGVAHTSVWASSNGWLSVGDTQPSHSASTNQCPLPASAQPNNVIAGIWDDLDHWTGIVLGLPYGKGYYKPFEAGSCPYDGYTGACAITQWDGMFQDSLPDPLTFEIILFDNNEILIQIEDDGPKHGGLSTTGIEDANGFAGLTYACNSSNSLSAPLAIRYTPPAGAPAYEAPDNYLQAPYKMEEGNSFDYMLVISNTGEVDGETTVISDVLPTEVTQTAAATIVQMTSGVSGTLVNDFPPAGSAIQWSGMIPAGEGLTIQVPVQTTALTNTMFTNTVMISDSVLSQTVQLAAPSYVYPTGELFYYESFNDGPGSSVSNNEWQWGMPEFGPTYAHSPNGLWGTDLDGEYDNGTTSILTMTLDLTSIPVTHTVMLQWWEWLETHACCDFGSVKISSPSNPTPTTIYGPSSGNSGGWVEVMQDISAYGGEIVTLTFTLEPNLTRPDKGWYIDDLSIHNIVPPTPAIELVKTVGTNPSQCATTDTIAVTSGTPVYYCYTVTNSGEVTFTEHSLADSHLGAIISPTLPFVLPPGATTDTVSLGLTFTTMITTDTVNSATWTASDGTAFNTVSATDDATARIIRPEITLEQTVGTNPGVCATTDTISVLPGTTVYYCLKGINTGDVTLLSHSVSNSLLGNVIPNLTYPLAPGASITNLDAGIVLNTVVNADTINSTTWTASNSTDLVSATDMATVTIGTLGVELTKTVGTQAGTCATTDTITVTMGTDVYYCYTIKNTGTVTLTSHTLDDDDSQLGNIFTDLALTLGPGESLNNIEAGRTVSTTINSSTTSDGTWSAKTDGSTTVASASDSTTVTMLNPTIELSQTVGTQAGVCATTDTISVASGTEVYYCYQVTNTGDTTLSLHTLDDDQLGNLFTGHSHTLAPGESYNNIDAGISVSTTINSNTTNVGTWSATTNDPSVVATATHTTTVMMLNPAIEVSQTVGTEAGVCATTDTISVASGTEVYYCYQVTNTGDTTLSLHTLDDDLLDNIFTGHSHTLAPGESYNNIDADISVKATINSDTTNVGTWSATTDDPSVVATASDSTSVTVLNPAIEVSQTVGTQAGVCATTDTISVASGTEVYYCYQVTNTGDTTLSLHTLDDDQLGNLFTGHSHTLAPGESYNNIDADISVKATINSNTTNVGTWSATTNDPSVVATATDTTTVTVLNPAIEVRQTVGTEAGVCATTDSISVVSGSEVYYCYQVTNTGDTTLSLHTLDDDQLGNLFGGHSHTLAPGESYNNIDADISVKATINSDTTNVGTWSARTNDPSVVATATDTTTVTVLNPAIEVRQTVGTEAGVCATTNTISVVSGSEVYYCYQVTNTGDTTLSLHTLDDDQLGNLFSGQSHTLAPGESFNNIDADISVKATINSDTTNVGTWSATTDDPTVGATASNSTTVTVTQPPSNLSLQLEQTVGTEEGVCATTNTIEVGIGSDVYYCYKVTNTGDTTLSLHTLVDDQLGNLFTGYSHTLAPGESFNTVDANMPVTSMITTDTTNIVTWTGYNSGSTDVATATDSTTIRVTGQPLAVHLANFNAGENSHTSPRTLQQLVGILVSGIMLLGATGYLAKHRRRREHSR